MNSSKYLVALAAAVSATIFNAATASAETLQVQTSTQSGGFSFRYLADNWAPRLKEATGGRVEIEFMPIKSVMPRNETPRRRGCRRSAG